MDVEMMARIRALELALEAHDHGTVDPEQTVIETAEEFYHFLIGETE